LHYQVQVLRFHSNYALFLMKIHKKHDQAEKHYKKALELEPNNAVANGNYALFLTKIHKKHDQSGSSSKAFL
jgi:Tfp pilus assembly protein PilF